MRKISPKPVPLSAPLDGEPEHDTDVEVRYRPLPAFSVADYVEDYATMLESSGALDSLRYSGAELVIRPERVDLAGLASLAIAFLKLLKSSAPDTDDQPASKAASRRQLRSLMLDHFQRFKVEAREPGGEWHALDSIDAIESWLDFTQATEVTYYLAGQVLLPLINRLLSVAGGGRKKSPEPSESASAIT